MLLNFYLPFPLTAVAAVAAAVQLVRKHLLFLLLFFLLIYHPILALAHSFLSVCLLNLLPICANFVCCSLGGRLLLLPFSFLPVSLHLSKGNSSTYGQTNLCFRLNLVDRSRPSSDCQVGGKKSEKRQQQYPQQRP